jgi:hypothetical protein
MKHQKIKNRTIILKSIPCLIFIFCCAVTQAQTLKVGSRIQKTQNMYWENGLSAQYSFENFKPNQFFVGFDFVSSRLGSAFNSNAIKQDNYLLSASWHFNKNKLYHLVTRLNVGYFYSDLEEDIFKEIPNTAFLFSPEIGFSYDFRKLPISLNVGTGYYIITEKEGYSPGTLQPLYFHFDIYYTFTKPKK